MPTQPATQPATDTAADDFLPINGTDYIEFYVGNAAEFYFTVQHSGFPGRGGARNGSPRPGVIRPAAGKIRFVLTTCSNRPPDPDHLKLHDGCDIALWVDDANRPTGRPPPGRPGRMSRLSSATNRAREEILHRDLR